MIADFVNFVTAGIGFYHAASHLTLRRALRRGISTIMTKSWTRRQFQYPWLKSSASARDCP
jgi:hypothetical protein